MNKSDAYWEGYQCYQNGGSLGDNPYYSEDTKWLEWKEGYYDAAWDD